MYKYIILFNLYNSKIKFKNKIKNKKSEHRRIKN